MLQKSRGKTRPGVAKIADLPAGVPEPAGQATPRNDDGTFRQGPGTAAIAAKGGRAKAEAERMRRLLGLAEAPVEVAPYVRQAEEIRAGVLRDLASDVGGGQVSSVVTMLVSLAARAKAMSLLCQDCALVAEGDQQIALLDRADKYGTTARGHLIAAREIAAKDAQARGKRAPANLPWFEPESKK